MGRVGGGGWGGRKTEHFTLIQTSEKPHQPPPPPSFHPAISPQPLQINLQNIDLRRAGVGGAPRLRPHINTNGPLFVSPLYFKILISS